jgi:quinohemoprotein ethanol dehydrogenase
MATLGTAHLVAARANDAVSTRGLVRQLLDSNDGGNWPGYGRTYGEQHYSPLTQITQANVKELGLAWSRDLGPQNSATQPIAINGLLYYATGLSVVHATDAASGKELWTYDPKAAEKAGLNLRHGWGVRGIGWWNNKIYTGTVDGRLIAIDAKRGTPVWSVQTYDPSYPAHINGAPRVFDGKVIVGYASSTGATRGYVTTYDAETGRQLWRFYTVPGNPADGFENPAMEMAAKTWAGTWWKHGGGGADVWNAIAYDPETDTVFIGTGSAYAENRRVRSADQGDNLFVSSIVALAGKSGAYKWHYQTTPGDTWDFDAVMDIELADLTINGKPRKVLMQAPKNGFFYVIDRVTGELISAKPFAKVTWATGVDLKTGRPIEAPGARYPNGAEAEIWPMGVGAHSWMPMAYNPTTRLVYIPKIEFGARYTDKDIDLKNWQPPTDRAVDVAFGFGAPVTDVMTGALVAWDPVAQKASWVLSRPTMYNGGVLTSAGGLVFQGTIDGTFNAYSASTGALLWSFSAQAPLIASPISYAANDEQYVTVLTGLGMGIVAGAGWGGAAEKYGLDARSQARRVLTFKVGGKSRLPPTGKTPVPPLADPQFKVDTVRAVAGEAIYDRLCSACHGPGAVAVIQAPDLRRSGIPLTAEAFERIVRGGASVPNGMPAFAELTDTQLAEVRQYLRTKAHELREAGATQ